MMLGKKMLNDENLEGNVVISPTFYQQYAIQCFDKKNDRKRK